MIRSDGDSPSPAEELTLHRAARLIIAAEEAGELPPELHALLHQALTWRAAAEERTP